MGVITGEGAKVDSFTCLERFEIIETGEDNAVSCSSAGGAVVRGDTNRDWTGTANGFGHTPPKMPGEKFQFTGIDREGQGYQSDVDGAIVDALRIFCNLQQSKLFFWQMWFSAAGALTPGEYEVSDTAIPNPSPSVLRKMKRGTPDVVGVSYWDLLLFRNNAAPLWTGESRYPNRDRGHLDATITWVQAYDTASLLPTVGTPEVYKLYVTETLFWEVDWAQVLRIPRRYVIRNEANETEYVEARMCQAKFTAYKDGVAGKILRPDASRVWPDPV